MDNQLEEQFYDTNMLKVAEYAYQYKFPYFDSCGENKVIVNGKRHGIIYPCDNSFVDLISGLPVSRESIITETNFDIKDTILNLQNIKNIFISFENVLGWEAYEYRYDRTLKCGTLFGCVPYDVHFKASETRFGLIDEFEKQANILEQDNEPNCELDKLVSKIKNKFKRK